MRFEALGPEGCLSQGSARVLMQDAKGFLWVGTQSGLNRFDGIAFRTFYHDPNDPNSLSDDFINAMVQDRQGKIWLATQNGLSCYDPATEKFHNYFASGKPGDLPDARVLTLIIDAEERLCVATAIGLSVMEGQQFHSQRLATITKMSLTRDGTLWVGTTQGGFYRDTQDQLVPLRPAEDPIGISQGAVMSFAEGQHGDLWLTDGNGVCRISAANRANGSFDYSWYPIARNPGSVINASVITLHVDSQNTLRVASLGSGFFQYDALTDSFHQYTLDVDDYSSLPNMYIFDIMEDRSGNLYFGTGGSGVACWIKSKSRFPLLRPGAGSVNSAAHFIWSIVEDKRGHLWLSSQGVGVYELDASRQLINHYLNDPKVPGSLPGNVVRSMAFDKEDTLWLGTYASGLCYLETGTTSFQATEINTGFVDKLMVDSRGLIWLGMRGLGVVCYQKGEGIIALNDLDLLNPLGVRSGAINEIREMDDEHIWIGHYQGLDQIHVATGLVTAIITPEIAGFGQSGYRVRTIFKSSNGQIWLGSDQGLAKLSQQDDNWRIHNYDRQHGLPDNVIYAIAEGIQGQLWLSTNKGLSNFQPQTETFTNYTMEDGLQANEYNTGAYLTSSRGELAFCGVHGCNIFYPESMNLNPTAPSMALTDFSRFGAAIDLPQSITEIQEIKLPYSGNSFTLGFAALEFTNPARNTYAHLLEEYDEDWRPAGNRNTATYTRVPPGTYYFRVKGTNNDQVWSTADAQVKIIIQPPFWLTWWFRILTVAALTLWGWLSYRRFMRTRLNHVRLESQLDTARDMQLGLMPLTQPKIAGFDIAGVCRPADQVGGDYYDYLPMGDLTGIALVDVNTRSMEGAITTIMSSGLMHAEILSHSSPAKILSNMNTATWRKTNRKTFVAMALAALNPKDKTLTFANAGLPPLLVYRQGECHYHRGTGMRLPLGAMRRVTYQEVIIPLQVGDLIVLYTDGLNEAMSPNHTPFDFQGIELCLANLPDTASARTTVNELLRAVHLHEDNGEIHDDTTMVVLRVLP